MWLPRTCSKVRSLACIHQHFNGRHGDLVLAISTLHNAISHVHYTGLAEARASCYTKPASDPFRTESSTITDKLLLHHVKPSSQMFIGLFKACGAMRDVELGRKLHADACKGGYMADVYVGNTVLCMYGKCGVVAEAESVFCALSKHTIVSWNLMLLYYSQDLQGEKVLRAYQQIEEESLSPDVWTFAFTLRACSSLQKCEEVCPVDEQWIKTATFDIGRAFHSLIKKRGLAQNPLVGNILVSLYGKYGAIKEAEMTFGTITVRTIVSWTAMLSTYIENGQEEMALLCYKQMQGERLVPDKVALTIAFKGCCLMAEREESMVSNQRLIKFRSFEIGKSLHRDACELDVASDPCVCTSIIVMYSKCGAISESQEAFLMLQCRDTVSWNAMLSVCLEQGEGERVLSLYSQMQQQSVCIDEVTLIHALHACCEYGSLEFCEKLHFIVVCMKLAKLFSLMSTLINAYGNCGCMLSAEASFDQLVSPDLISWSVLLFGHANEGNDIIVLQLFQKLGMLNIALDNGIFTSILTACSHSGLVSEGLECFESIRRESFTNPKLVHYGVMTDLFSRIGDFNRVSNMLNKMPMQPDLAIWLFLLGSCRTHSNIEVAEEAFARAVSLAPKQASPYILMSYVCATAGLCDRMKEVENLRYKNGLQWSQLD